MFRKDDFGYWLELDKSHWFFNITFYKPTFIYKYGEEKRQREWFICPFQFKFRSDYFDLGFDFMFMNFYIGFTYYKRDPNVTYTTEEVKEMLGLNAEETNSEV